MPIDFIIRSNVFTFSSYLVTNAPHQWRSDTALKAGRWEVPGSNPGRTCRPEFRNTNRKRKILATT